MTDATSTGTRDHAGPRVSRGVELMLVWCGPAAALLLAVGLVPLAQFIPPPHPGASAQEIKELYTDNLTGVRAGMVLSIIGLALLAPWGVAIALQTRRIEGGRPALTYVQLVSIAISWTTGVLAILVWAVAAFRPEDVPADITRTLNDLGWFLFLFPWPPFAVWFIAVGMAILRDTREVPIFPRWAGYLSFWVALAIAPGALLVFFKTGPFAFNGLITFYVAFVDFFAWVIVMTVLAGKAINKEAGVDLATEREAPRS